ncbi:MAG: hypothetical protein ACE5EE_11380, partial [Fidelibacterota bacterium]
CGEDSTECCLDTTSHNFVWEIDTLGDYGSYLNDVAIIDENNIWVVGYIKDGDSTYNAAHWEGNEWEFILISPAGLTNPISCIFAFNENNIWFGKVGLPVHWDGQNYYKYTPANSSHPGQPSINSIWGSNSNDLYFVGDNGSIVHYDGSGFTKMESLPGQGGTDVDLIDIYGTDEEHIWIVGDDDQIGKSIVLEYSSGEWHTKFAYTYNEPTDGVPEGRYRSVCTIGDTLYIFCGTVLWKESITGGEGYGAPHTLFPAGGTNRLRGIDYNDIFDVGYCQKVMHYNGKNWTRIFPHDCDQLVNYNSVDYIEGMVVIVGLKGQVLMGKR